MNNPVLPTAPRSPGIDLLLDGRLLTLPLLELVAHLGADRPDRIEATVRVDGTPGADGMTPGAIRPGSLLVLAIGGTRLSAGTVDRVSLGWSSSGRTITLVAYAEYHGRRRAAGPRRYFETTDAEIATDVAARLGLIARVEPTAEVCRLAQVDGDPLRDLRRRARARGFHLAVAEGRLHFAAEPPPAPAELRLASGGGILGLELVDRGERGRGGSIDAAGDPRLRPLAAIDLSGVDPRTDGRYRVVRAVHRIDAEGYIVRVEILDTGLDFAAWSDGREGGGDGLAE